MITNWDIPFILRSPTLGDLTLQAAKVDGVQRYVIVPEDARDQIELRVTDTFIPAADGAIPNRRFKGFYRTTLPIQLRVGDAPACDEDLTEMTDTLMGWLDSMLNDEGRLLWTPPGAAQRMYDEVRWHDAVEWSLDENGITRLTFGLDTPFPYAIAAAQTTVNVSGPTVLNNTGNTKFWPVIKVNGPTAGFTISNTTTGEEIVYDSALPGAIPIGGGDYGEIDTFRNTFYLNGDQTNLKPGLVMTDSDFWGLPPGLNALDTDGPDYDVLFNAPFV